MIKNDILFSGFYGQKNSGDDAFVEVLNWGAKEIWEKEKFRFLAVSSKMPQTLDRSFGYPLEIPKSYNLQDDILIRNCKYLISGGGSTIHSYMTKDNIKRKALNIKKDGGKIKIGGVGVSIGPFKSIKDEVAVKEYLKSIDFLALRDRASFDFASSLELPYSPVKSFDLAALLPYIYNNSSEKKVPEYVKNERSIVGISICPVESINAIENIAKEEMRSKMLLELVRSLEENGDIHFKFFIFNGNKALGDLNFTQNFISKLTLKSWEIINYTKEVKQVWDDIATCDFVIATRLHAAIFSCFNNVPFFLNEYHKKCSDFLEDIGVDDDFRLFNSDYDIQKKATMILEILKCKTKYTPPKLVCEMKELAMLNFSAIKL